MGYRLAADLILILHLLFILFVLLGGLLCFCRKSWAWVHIPAMIWGLWVEWAGWVCPLTPLENYCRVLATDQGYQGSFIEHYLARIVYPGQISPATQWLLGACLLAVNVLIYLLVCRTAMKRRHQVDA